MIPRIETSIPRLVIGGTHSGVGKTTITAGLIRALRNLGLVVQPFKAGPDYIDPTYLTLAAGTGSHDCTTRLGDAASRVCRNLDTWMVPPERVAALFAQAAGDADIAVIEGVMGLYDGFGYDDDAGSTARLARLLRAPTILVLDASHLARSAAALALGYAQFDPELSLGGFIVNRVGSSSHGQGVASAVERAIGLPVLGWLPRDSGLEIPERHLGLVPTAERGQWHEFVEAAADQIGRHVDLDRLQSLARSAPSLTATSVIARRPMMGPGPRIAVARDEAFSFTYQDNLNLLSAAGAELVFFSPLRDRDLPSQTVGVILGGGFPEIFAEQLANNAGMQQSLRQAHALGVPIYAECGGLMFLTEAIVDPDGREYPMVGLLPGRSVMTTRLTMGYRLARAVGESWFLRQGESVRAHEFHYALWEDRPAGLPPAYRLCSPRGGGQCRFEGACVGNLWASYVHVHFASKPELAVRFVEACQRGKQD